MPRHSLLLLTMKKIRNGICVLFLAAVMAACAFGAVSYFSDYQGRVLQAEGGVSLELIGDAGIASTSQNGYVEIQNGIGWYRKGSMAGITATPGTGYSFQGWYVDEGEIAKEQTASVTMDGRKMLEARTNPIAYNVIYYSDHEAIAGSEDIYTIETAYRLKTAEELNLSKWGYEFAGWYDNPDLAGSIYTELPQGTYGDKAFYAKWERNTCTVTFHANGGSVSPSTKEYETGSRFTSSPTPVRNGYTFEGWYTGATGGVRWTESAVVNEDIILYAHWRLETYQISYYNGTIRLDMGTTYPGNGSWNDVNLTGVEQMEWDGYANSAYVNMVSLPMWSASSAGVPEELRVPNAYVSLDQGGTTYLKTYKYYDTYDTEKAYQLRTYDELKHNLVGKPGYTFDGWTLDESGNGDVVSEIPVGSYGDQKFYAKWIKEVVLLPGSELASVFWRDGSLADMSYLRSITVLEAGDDTFADNPYVDLSLKQDGSIKGYKDGDAFYVDWYIASPLGTKIVANEDCTDMFNSKYCLTYEGSFTSINHLELIDMKNVKYVDGMFQNCQYLEGDIILKNFSPVRSQTAFEYVGYSSSGVTLYSDGSDASVIQEMLNSCFNNVMYGGDIAK